MLPLTLLFSIAISFVAYNASVPSLRKTRPNHLAFVYALALYRSHLTTWLLLTRSFLISSPYHRYVTDCHVCSIPGVFQTLRGGRNNYVWQEPKTYWQLLIINIIRSSIIVVFWPDILFFIVRLRSFTKCIVYWYNNLGCIRLKRHWIYIAIHELNDRVKKSRIRAREYTKYIESKLQERIVYIHTHEHA